MTAESKLTMDQLEAMARAPWCYPSAAMTKALLQLVADLKAANAQIEELDFLRHEGGPDSVAALEAEVARLTEARVVLIASDRGVCIGGRWDGWLMVRHPDGHWVSHHKLETVDPATEMTDLLRTAHAARQEGGA